MARKKISINSLRQLRQYKDFIKPDELENDLINTLAEYGQKIINMAYRTSTYTDRTLNLRDSYVSAVFKNGTLVPGTKRYVTLTSKDSPSKNISVAYSDMANGDPELRTGREEADLFLSKFQFSSGRPSGITLVVAAAMFYGGIIETKWNYKVISHVSNEMDRIAEIGIQLNKTRANIDKIYIKSPRVIRDGGVGRMQIKM